MAKKKTSAFRGKVNRNAEKQETKASSYGYLNLPKGVKMFKPDGGKTYLFDILPYIVTDEHHMDRDDEDQIAVVDGQWYRKPFQTHKSVGPEEETIICPGTFGLPCPICKYAKQMQKDGAEWEDILPFKAKDRSLYIVLPIDAKEFEEEYHIFDMSFHLFQKQLNEELLTDEENEIFPDLEEGKSLKVRFSEEKFGKNTFPKTSRIDFKERDSTYEEDVLEEVPNLDDLLTVLSYDQIETMFVSMEEADASDEVVEDVEDDDEPEQDSKSRRKPKTTKKAEKEDEDEPEEKSTRKSRTSKKEEEKEDEPEDEDEPDKELDEKKTRKPKGKTAAKKKADDDEECPEGFTFGKDADDHKECDSCELWDKCSALKYN